MNALIRLTSLAHGGGCGCKLSPSVLRGILARMPEAKLESACTTIVTAR